MSLDHERVKEIADTPYLHRMMDEVEDIKTELLRIGALNQDLMVVSMLVVGNDKMLNALAATMVAKYQDVVAQTLIEEALGENSVDNGTTEYH